MGSCWIWMEMLIYSSVELPSELNEGIMVYDDQTFCFVRLLSADVVTGLGLWRHQTLWG